MPTLVDRTVHLDASPDDVFALIGDHARLPEWAPGVARVEIDATAARDPGGAGTVRTLFPRFGRAGRELVHELDRTGRLLRYGATDASLAPLCRSHRATLSCTSDGRGTALRFVVEAEPRGAMPFVLARWMFALAISASFRALVRHFGSRETRR